MAAKYIWRVQDRRGWGPYRAFYDRWLDEPAPWMDDCAAFGIRPAEEFGRDEEEIAAICLVMGAVHGFLTRAQAWAWFSAVELARLQREGFYLVRCPVEHIIYGDAASQQVVAAPRGAFDRAKNKNLTDFFQEG